MLVLCDCCLLNLFVLTWVFCLVVCFLVCLVFYDGILEGLLVGLLLMPVFVGCLVAFSLCCLGCLLVACWVFSWF